VPATASYSPTGDSYTDGVLGGTKWAVATLTFSFPSSAAFYGSGYGYGEPTNNFQAFNPVQQAAVRSVLLSYASVMNVKFTEMAETSTQHADLRFGESDTPGTAWAYYPSTTAVGGDAWFNSSSHSYDNPQLGNYAWHTLIHETGHAMGLKHPHEASGNFGPMPTDRDSLEYSVMSYHSYVGATQPYYTNENWSYPQSLMMYDIAALQVQYGADYTTNAGNSVYRWNPQTGEMFIDGAGQGAPGGNRVFLTIWDGGGVDTYDFSNYATNLKVSLQPGEWTTVSSAQLANLGNGHFAAGNIANALLYQNNPASLIENVIGGLGNDTIYGNAADNSFTGGHGNDVLDGGTGTNTAVYSGNSSAYSIVNTGYGTWTVTDNRGGSPDGTDSLKNIRYLKFNDVIIDLGPTQVLITGTSAADTIDATHTPAGQQLPTNSNDVIYGVGGNDTISGLGGGDYIDGGAGTDTVTYATSAAGVTVGLVTAAPGAPGGFGGDAQADTLVNIENLIGSNFDDTLEGNAGNNKLVGGLGIDTVSYAHAASGANGLGVTVSLAVTKAQNTVTAGKDTLIGFENLIGSEFNDTLTGSSGNNVLTGLGGNDRLDGGKGADRMIGGMGNDTYIVDTLGDLVDETEGDGIDTVLTSISFTLGDPAYALGAIEYLTLTGRSSISGAGNDLDNVLIGNVSNNMLWGLGGNDYIDGGKGADIMIGANGNDTYVVDNKGDIVNEAIGGDGIDTVLSAVSFSFVDPAHVVGYLENLTLTGKSSLSGTGNELDNVIIGNSGNNILAGLGGGDYIDGGAGTDTVTYAASPAGVNVSLVTAAPDGPGGLGGDAQNDTLFNIENLTGSNFDDTLEGNAGNNVLDGGLGIDTVSYEHAGPGANGVGVTVSLATTSAQSTVTAGKDTLKNFENLTGSEFNDKLTGNAGNNVLTGLGGNDILTGRAGHDTFVFGPGFGKDVITDFSLENDVIAFDHSMFADFDSVLATASQAGSNTVITFDADNTLTLNNVTLSALHHDDFSFT
jgi:serralysin